MADRDQIDFYDPEEKVAASEQVKLSPKMQRYLLMGAGFILTLLLVLFIVNRIQQGRFARLELESRMQAGEAEIELSSGDCEGDTSCLNRVRTGIARDEGLPELCDGLSGTELDNCLSLIAIDLGNRDICKPVSDAAKETCEDAATLQLATSTLDIDACNEINNAATFRSCTVQVTNSVIALDACSQYGLDEALCDADRLASDAYERVLRLQDIAACDDLGGLDPVTCMDLLSSNDFDGDGLNDRSEIELYGTDPRNSDTDGDGYADRVEIESGFDPLS